MSSEVQKNKFKFLKNIYNTLLPFLGIAGLASLLYANLSTSESVMLFILMILSTIIFIMPQKNENCWEKLIRIITYSSVVILVLFRILPNFLEKVESYSNLINRYIPPECYFYVEIISIIVAFISIYRKFKKSKTSIESIFEQIKSKFNP